MSMITKNYKKIRPNLDVFLFNISFFIVLVRFLKSNREDWFVLYFIFVNDFN